MKDLIRKPLRWLHESNRDKHLLGGALVGFLSTDLYCSLLSGTAAGASLELKDKLYGGKPDAVDFALTLLGSLIGYALRSTLTGWAWV